MSTDAVESTGLGCLSRRSVLRLAVLAGACSVAPAALAFVSPLDQPAMASSLIARSSLLDVVYTGERIVAVGMRGGIVYSDDRGATWIQADVPVSTDLVALCFVGPRKGWVVGHGGVVLHSDDGGKTWRKQLDGLQASRLAVGFYRGRIGSLADADALLQREQSLAVEGETQPFLDLCFIDELRGYVVGTFNRIFTTEDGGQSWSPLMHVTDNPGELHFYAIQAHGDQLYIAGEQGHVWRRDPVTGRFETANTPYDGTLFGLLAVDDETLLAYGMRGSLYLSHDQGRSWGKVDSRAQGAITSAFSLPDGSLVIVDQSGGAGLSHDKGRSFTPLRIVDPMPFFGGTALMERKVVLVGALGVRIETV